MGGGTGYGHASSDKHRPEEMTIADHIPLASLLIQPGVSHFSFLQDPDQFTRDVEHFLEHAPGL
jgi:pimeloyl-ACP methyl ester carboxylesterase